MKPKKKAKSLINMFSSHVKDWNYSYDIPLDENHAKHCALIAVNEILNHHLQEQSLYRIDKYYWQEVKQELEKL